MASQLDKLGLCTTDLLTKLCDYRDRRDYWFEQIATHHDIPEVTSTGASKRDAVKAAPDSSQPRQPRHESWSRAAAVGGSEVRARAAMDESMADKFDFGRTTAAHRGRFGQRSCIA